jgi:Holliday junction resolvase
MKPWQKGARIEREIVAAHAELGIAGERVPLSGAARYRGNGADVDLYVFGPDAAPIVCEVKARASGEGFQTLERWLGDADALFLRRDRADPLVVLPWQTWARLVPGMARAGRNGAAANAENRLLAQSAADAQPDIGAGNGAPAATAGFCAAGAARFGPAQREALDMVAVKLARILACVTRDRKSCFRLSGF